MRALTPAFAFAMTVEDAIEILPLSEETVTRLYKAGRDNGLHAVWGRLTLAQRDEIAAAAAREEAYSADLVAKMLS